MKEEIVSARLPFLVSLISPSSELFLQAAVQNHPMLQAMCFTPRLFLPFKDILIGTFVRMQRGSDCVFCPPTDG